MTFIFRECRQFCVAAVNLRIFAVIVLSCMLLANVSPVSSSNNDADLIELKDDNWQLMLKGEWMVEFFAPWCPACKNLAPIWERFATTAATELQVKVAKIDVTMSPSLSGRFFVTALPTIYHVKDGEFRQYRGSRDGDVLLQFLKQEQWQRIEPISSWKKPDTLHMSVLSYFFKLSHTLKNFNTYLQEEYGLPIWGSYALLAIGTIFIGAALGLLLVCVVDFLYPPKKSQRQNFSNVKGDNNVGDNIEDLANDEIEDDVDEDNNYEEDDNENDEDEDDEAPELVPADEDKDNEDDEEEDNEEEDNEEEDNEDNDDSTASDVEDEPQLSKKISKTVPTKTNTPPKSPKVEKDDSPKVIDVKKSTEKIIMSEQKDQTDKIGGGEARKRRARKAD